MSELKTHLYILYQFILGSRLRFFDKPMYTQFQHVFVDSEAIADVSKKHPRLLRKMPSFHLISLEDWLVSNWLKSQPVHLELVSKGFKETSRYKLPLLLGNIMWQICKTYYPSADSEGYSFIMNSVDFCSCQWPTKQRLFQLNVANVILIILIK